MENNTEKKKDTIFLLLLVSLIIPFVNATGYCQDDIGIRYSYGNSFGTGIAIGENNTWISDAVANLTKGESYQIKYYIDNKINSTVSDVHIALRIDNVSIIDYNKSINNYHSKQINLNISNLAPGNYNISLSEIGRAHV